MALDVVIGISVKKIGIMVCKGKDKWAYTGGPVEARSSIGELREEVPHHVRVIVMIRTPS